MTQIFSFPPISNSDARVLILGSMPGAMSLRLQQYYGHPQNAFWKIVGEIFGFDARDGYAQRAAALVQHKVALWDVLAACVREGSLDSAIDSSSVVPNDFAAFFLRHPNIRRVCFNGATAESVYRKKVLPTLSTTHRIEYIRLPSTSPAHAGMSFVAKAAAWRVIDSDFGEEKAGAGLGSTLLPNPAI